MTDPTYSGHETPGNNRRRGQRLDEIPFLGSPQTQRKGNRTSTERPKIDRRGPDPAYGKVANRSSDEQRQQRPQVKHPGRKQGPTRRNTYDDTISQLKVELRLTNRELAWKSLTARRAAGLATTACVCSTDFHDARSAIERNDDTDFLHRQAATGLERRRQSADAPRRRMPFAMACAVLAGISPIAVTRKSSILREKECIAPDAVGCPTTNFSPTSSK